MEKQLGVKESSCSLQQSSGALPHVQLQKQTPTSWLKTSMGDLTTQLKMGLIGWEPFQ